MDFEVGEFIKYRRDDGFEFIIKITRLNYSQNGEIDKIYGRILGVNKKSRFKYIGYLVFIPYTAFSNITKISKKEAMYYLL